MMETQATVAKVAIRKRILKQLRQYARESPDGLIDASRRACHELFIYLQSRYFMRLSPPQQVFICAYLPLFYELDLRFLMHQLWRTTEKQRNEVEAVIFVPVVLSPVRCCEETPWLSEGSTEEDTERLKSAMIFVEVRDACDLTNSFEETPPYGIPELRRNVLAALFRTTRDSASTELSDSNSDRFRRVICCEEWSSLFPHYCPPPNIVDGNCLSIGRSTQTHTSLVVLAPGVEFSRTSGSRLGKGGGFYDRFLGFQRRHAHYANTLDPQKSVHPNAVEVIGVGFETQMVDNCGEEVPLCVHDEPVDTVASECGVWRCSQSEHRACPLE